MVEEDVQPRRTAMERARDVIEPILLAAGSTVLALASSALARINANLVPIGAGVVFLVVLVVVVWWGSASPGLRHRIRSTAWSLLVVWLLVLLLKPDGYYSRYQSYEAAARDDHALRDSLADTAPERARIAAQLAHDSTEVRDLQAHAPHSTTGAGPQPDLLVRRGSWPLAFQPPVNQSAEFEIPSYVGPCAGLPPGQMCFQFDDHYVALIADTLSGERGWSGSGTLQIEKIGGAYADYYHVLGSKRLDVVRLWRQPDRPSGRRG